jgi:hypothetical protein
VEAKRQSTAPLCPHCERPLRPFRLPDNSGWDDNVHLACFEDDCPYFRRGWTWMFDHYGVKASYRYRIDPVSGTESPLPVWSRDAIKDCILDADVVAEPMAGDDVSGEQAGDRGPGTGDRPPTHPKKNVRTSGSPRKGRKT